jgi:hypothetical protein
VRYFLVGFWIAAGAPYLFKKLHLWFDRIIEN